MARELDAMKFANACHEGINQRRKYSGLPYIVHPATVVAILRTIQHTPAMIQAGWLHDTVEDTGVTHDDIRRAFGDEVATLVEMVTDVSKKSDGNRAARRAIDLRHLENASSEAAAIKLADIIDNTHDIVLHDPDFARVYLHEKTDTLAVLRPKVRNWSEPLWYRAVRQINEE